MVRLCIALVLPEALPVFSIGSPRRCLTITSSNIAVLVHMLKGGERELFCFQERSSASQGEEKLLKDLFS